MLQEVAVLRVFPSEKFVSFPSSVLLIQTCNLKAENKLKTLQIITHWE